jgi:uncharacterized protein (DUF433 family)
MGRRSKIEAHPRSEEIIRLLASGAKNPEIVRNFPGIKDDDLDYYRVNKLPQIISKSTELKSLAEQIETADIHRGDTYLQLVIGLQKKALDALDSQDPTQDPKSWAMISREARGYLELLGKALDRIRDQPQVTFQQISVYDSPEWSRVGETLREILSPYPDLRSQVARRLLELAQGDGRA